MNSGNSMEDFETERRIAFNIFTPPAPLFFSLFL